ncbi:hypothetical protein JW930_07690 [Candidatus Woesearchaeota archaeon]|nr:hypothetical protein [Candidatus Woesearchaeota archaeon]
MTLNYDLEALIMQVFRPRRGERVLLLNDYPSDSTGLQAAEKMDYDKRREMVRTWHNALINLATQHGFTVEGIITYEPTGGHGADLPRAAVQVVSKIDLQHKLHSLTERDIVIAITRFSPTAPLFSLIEKEGKRFRAATMPGAWIDMRAFEADYEAVKQKARILAREITAATHATVTFSYNRKDYVCTFDLRGRKGKADDGVCRRPKQRINFPSGEAFAAAYEGDHRGLYNRHILGQSRTKGEIPVLFGETLVVYHVENGRIIEVVGTSEKANEMRDFFDADPARRFIAEFAGGCNDRAEDSESVLESEKREGFHWAYGLNRHFYRGRIRPQFFKFKPVHNDVVYGKGGPIKVKIELFYEAGPPKVIMRDTQYLPEVLGEVFR